MQSNVVYGMYSGLALMLDVYEPEEPNGYGVIFISGSGWSAPLGMDATPLKRSGQEQVYAVPLMEAGYTTFAINHRAAPRFTYPDAIEDAQRAVRFARHHADAYGIRKDRIGALGGSSGGHLVLMLGCLKADGDPESGDPLLQESANVQCVVARAAPSNFMIDEQSSYAFLRSRPPGDGDTASPEYQIHRNASPVTHVSADSPPALLMHGSNDEIVAYNQSVTMLEVLQSAGVTSELLTIPGGGHGARFSGAQEPVPDYVGRSIAWMDTHLKD
jgi:acetyl esterase/lipase